MVVVAQGRPDRHTHEPSQHEESRIDQMPQPELIFLHALPLDGSMWASQMDLLPGHAHAPTLYGFVDTVEEWAAAALRLVSGDRLIVVGCSVGGSCAVEIAAVAPERVAALVLIGTKADHRPDPDLHAAARQMLREHGVENAWQTYWAPLFSSSVDPGVVAEAKAIALGQSAEAISRGVTAFHTRPSRGAFLKAVRCPVIVVTGADDIAPGPAVSAAQAHEAHRGRVHVIPDCGHYVPLEQPGRLNGILREVIEDEMQGTANFQVEENFPIWK